MRGAALAGAVATGVAALAGGAYERLSPDADGLLKSRVFPGLWLDSAALLGGDLARVLFALQAGIAALEHQQFAERLNTVE